nr:PREDICTED: uncharacterized protein LOC109036419 [Bemisia tabaci]
MAEEEKPDPHTESPPEPAERPSRSARNPEKHRPTRSASVLETKPTRPARNKSVSVTEPRTVRLCRTATVLETKTLGPPRAGAGDDRAQTLVRPCKSASVSDAPGKTAKPRKLARKLSRRLSMVAKMPALFNSKQIKGELGFPKRSRNIEIVAIAPDKTQRNLVGSASQTIGHIVSKIIDEFKIKDLGLSLGGSRAQVDPHAFVSLLEGDILVIEDRTPSWDPKGDEDRLFRLTEQLVAGERSFETTLRSAKEIYAGSSHRLEFFIEEDYRLIFDNVSDLADASHEFSQQMADVLKNWETDAKQIGQIFKDKYLDQFDAYLNEYGQIRRVLQEKYLSDDEFLEYHKFRQGATLLRLEDILQLPVQRLTQYEEYLTNLLDDPRTDHDDTTTVRTRVNQAVKRRQEESNFERFQDLFPSDSLRLYDRDVLTMGVQSPDRHLFLLDDLLLVTNSRSNLKEKDRMSELWLTKSAMGDVTKLGRSPDTSFVIGWPSNNVVATFRSAKTPDSDIKKKKSPGRMKIGQIFRRSHSKENPGCLFGLPLTKIVDGDELPRPVMAMLQQIHSKGPFTQGIFRKSANAKLVRDLRDKLDSGEEVIFEHVPVLATAALLKDFLRSLPDPLLVSALYSQWKAALDTPNIHHKLLRLKGVLQQLPRPNYILLSHFVCVLHHIARRSSQNLMSASNLGVCVGPSLLWSNNPHTPDLRTIPALVECLITHCEILLGSQVPQLLGDPRDSGTEESDSLRRDDSSIDSLECSPPPRKDKISLSRDSGLTMSDSQLYTPDEEESSSSSSGYDPAFDQHAKVTTALSMPNEYVRVYGGWEERLNPNFQRQAWFRQRSRRLHSTSKQAEKARNNHLSNNNNSNNTHNHNHQPVMAFSPGEQYYPAREQRNHLEPVEPVEYDDSSTLSDDDCTPHISRSNSRSNEVTTKLRHLPPVHVDTCYVRSRLKQKEDTPAHRSKSLPPPPPYRPPPPVNGRRPITTYHLGDNQRQMYFVPRTFVDEESYV